MSLFSQQRSGDSSLAGSEGDFLVALPHLFVYTLRSDMPIISLITQWVGKKNILNHVSRSPIYVVVFTNKEHGKSCIGIFLMKNIAFHIYLGIVECWRAGGR